MEQTAAGTAPAGQISLKGVGVYHGPSPYAQEPVVVADLTVGEAAQEARTQIVAAVREHFSDWDFTGDAAGEGDETLARFALQWAHAALTVSPSLIAPLGIRPLGSGRFRIWIGFHHPGASQMALLLAAKVLEAAMTGNLGDAGLGRRIAELEAACAREHPALQDQMILAAARAAQIPSQPAWNFHRSWLFGWGAKSELLVAGSSNREGTVSASLANDKARSKVVIRGLGLPALPYALVRQERDVATAIRDIGFPCVVKPLDGHGGRGVSANLVSAEQVRDAIEHARGFTAGPIMVEKFAEGNDHRIWLHDGSVICASRREPPAVTGNGSSTIRQLIADINRVRGQGGKIGQGKLIAIEIDEALSMHLSRQGLTPDSVPADGQTVVLRSNANISGGGSLGLVMPDAMHPDIVVASEALAQTLEFEMAGLDYITTDISRSWREVPGTFIELNQAPGVQMLVELGHSVEEAGRLALGEETGRVPLQLVVVPEDQIERAWEHLCTLVPQGPTGLAAHDRARIGTAPLSIGDAGRWQGVDTMLAHGAVETVVVLADSNRLQVHGLPVEWADRVWNCDPALPGEWADTIARTANGNAWSGDLSEFTQSDFSPAMMAQVAP